ncbi:hypothetical protein M408DRAFT_171942 [Serendipita vermifera MAFF 305830]|uniref:RRM domain-containing protein n=1 Tax=Serendipita vermifera MAFF 305830 TaxID=933852 RepID=A0A0C3B746_SERVB|nr:hypothetical protein M408DRAFT_171942 [Serendipita vermifera MAFF 305830]
MPGPASTSSNTRPSSTLPNAAQRQAVNTQTKVLDTVHGRILCIADIRGNLSHLNTLAAEANAKAIIHTGDFGFIDAASADRISDRTLRHLVMYSPLLTIPHRNRILGPENGPAAIREMITSSPNPLLSEFPLLLSGQIKLSVPVYTVYGACEDVAVIERFRAGQYNIDNLHVIDEATTRCIDIGGVKFRLLGLGGAFVPHKMFDNGDGQATIAGGGGTMWTTALQIGELVDTAQRVYDISETRVLVSHASPGREGLIAQLALAVKADLTISAGLHFRYPTSYNEFSVQSDFEGFRTKLLTSKENFEKIWDAVKSQVEAVLDDNQKILLEKAMSVVERIPPPVAAAGGSADENAWKNCWNWNLTDAAFGQLVLDIREGRVTAEMKSQGFNYAYRRQASGTGQLDNGLVPPQQLNAGATSTAPGSAPITKPGTPAPPQNANVNVKGPGGNNAVSPIVSKAGTPAPPADGVGPNGQQTSPTTEKDKEAAKREKRKQKEKEKKAEKAAEREAGKKRANGAAGEAGIDVNAANEDGTTSLVSPDADSAGAHTPVSRRGSRNPWTLFVKHLPVPVTEDEIKDFFGDAKSGIVYVKIPFVNQGPNKSQQRHFAYVEFGDEEAMKAGLASKGEKLRDSSPQVSIADENREPGGGRGRGRGGFAMRGLQAAGLGRQSGGRGKPADEEN